MLGSTEVYRSILDAVPYSIMIIDLTPGLPIVLMNPAGLEMLGYPNDGAPVRMSILDIVVKQQHAKLEERRLNLLAGESNPPAEFQLQRTDGSIIWVESKSVPVTLGGKTVGLLISKDVTSRRQAEQELRAVREQIQIAVRAANLGLWDWDLQTDRVFYSPEWKSQLGYDGDEVQDDLLAWEGLVHPDDRATAIERVRSYLAAPWLDYKSEFRMLHKDGSYRWILTQASLIYDDSGKPIRMLGAHIDITERKAAEQALKESEERFSKSFYNNPAAMQLADITTGERLAMNDRFYELFDYPTGDLLGTSVYTFNNMWLNPEEQKHMVELLVRDGVVRDFPADFRTASGQIKHLLVSSSLLKLRTHTAALISLVDLTERQRLEELRIEQGRLQANLKKEQEFNALIQKAVSELSHDLRIPLTVIGTTKDLLDRYFDRLDEEERREKLNTIEKQLHYVTQILNDMSLTVKGRLDQRTFQPTPVNLNVLCQVTLAEIQQTMKAKQTFRFVCDGQIEKALIDETLISRILLNLLSNAVKFSLADSEIRLELSQQVEWLVLRVVDQGIGIAEPDLSRIFEPFFRAETAETVVGTGLGLSIVKECVELHKGRISVESRVGQGTTFTVHLPLIRH
ncbi:MAG: PAS domain S-box protein [Anaerolinea sp.]|nr:PAS domain S-box protein [Anaerolinea sp.]